MDLQSVADAVHLPRATSHRILQVLCRFGFVQQHPKSKRYALGVMASWLGDQARQVFPLKTLAAPIMEAAVSNSGETLSLNVLIDDHRVCVHSVHGDSELRVIARPGQRLPVHLGSSGKILLAFSQRDQREMLLQGLVVNGSVADPNQLKTTLEEVVRRGWIGTRGERVSGIAAFAVPVWNPDESKVIASLALSMPEVRLTESSERSALALLFEAAEQIRLAMASATRSEVLNG